MLPRGLVTVRIHTHSAAPTLQTALLLVSAGARGALPWPEPPGTLQKLKAGVRMYTHIDAPALAIYAAPHRELPPNLRASDSLVVANFFVQATPSLSHESRRVFNVSFQPRRSYLCRMRLT
jgi:hypothetical protein